MPRLTSPSPSPARDARSLGRVVAVVPGEEAAVYAAAQEALHWVAEHLRDFWD